MKKLLCAFIAMLILNTYGFAQEGKSAGAAPKQEKKAEAKKEEHKTGGQKLKKDGTPDMRYKENKEAAKKAGPKMKKDGTPDMRVKENKMKADKKEAPKTK